MEKDCKRTSDASCGRIKESQHFSGGKHIFLLNKCAHGIHHRSTRICFGCGTIFPSSPYVCCVANRVQCKCVRGEENDDSLSRKKARAQLQPGEQWSTWIVEFTPTTHFFVFTSWEIILHKTIAQRWLVTKKLQVIQIQHICCEALKEGINSNELHAVRSQPYAEVMT